MKVKLTIAVLYDTWGEDEPPAPEEAVSTRKKKPPKKEKEDREEILEALRKLGHEAA